MNIIARPFGSRYCYCRPDTTWERENRDFYSPECVNEILWTPIVFARMSKAGKCIGNKFVQRYYDSVGCGVLLYCEGQDIAFTSCLDHTSILPSATFDPTRFEEASNTFEIIANGIKDSIRIDGNIKALLEETICQASQLTSLRTGDFVAIELDECKSIATRNEGKGAIRGSFHDMELFNFDIIF